MIINIFWLVGIEEIHLLNNITLLNNDVYRVTVKNKMFTSILAAFTLPEIYRNNGKDNYQHRWCTATYY